MSFTLESSQCQRFHRDGFVIVDSLINPSVIPDLHRAFDDLFSGRFETGVRPDEVNWQQGESDPSLSRQICNGWKANRDIARVVLDQNLAQAIGALTGWSGVRIMIDNVIWKAPATKSLGFHQDDAFLSWYKPGEIVTCWIYRPGNHLCRSKGRRGLFPSWSHVARFRGEPRSKPAAVAGVACHAARC